MGWPWGKKEEIRRLQERVQKLEEEKKKLQEERNSYRERFEAEKERRSELSKEKQEAEEKLNKLRQTDEQTTKEKEERGETEDEEVSLGRVKKMLSKLETVESPEEDIVTVYSPGKLKDLPDLKGLKNSVSREEYEFLSRENFAAFIDPDFFMLKLKARPFFSSHWSVGDSFRIDQIKGFIEERKQWAAVSAGETKIVKEENGEILEKEEVESRIERKQKKGGFSQGRFERKRDEQIEEHLDEVAEKISENTFLVGEERFCKKLPGKYLGGLDSSRRFLDALYGFRVERSRV